MRKSFLAGLAALTLAGAPGCATSGSSGVLNQSERVASEQFYTGNDEQWGKYRIGVTTDREGNVVDASFTSNYLIGKDYDAGSKSFDTFLVDVDREGGLDKVSGGEVRKYNTLFNSLFDSTVGSPSASTEPSE